MELVTCIGKLLKNKNEDPSEFLKALSDYELTEADVTSFNNSFLPKLFFLFEKQILCRDLVYLALLAKNNFNLLNLIIEYEKSNFILNIDDSVSLYNYCIYWDRHWIYDVLNNYEQHKRFLSDDNLKNKLFVVKLVQTTNLNKIDIKHIYSFLSEINKETIPKFWEFYIKQIKRLIEILEFFKNTEQQIDNEDDIFHFASSNSLLMTLTTFMDLDNETFHDMILNKINEFQEKYNEDKSQTPTFIGFIIISTIIKLITQKTTKIPIMKVLQDLKEKFLTLDNSKLQIELLENIFSLLFYKIKNELVCGDKELRLLLHLLKDLSDELKFKKIYEKNTKDYDRFQSLNIILSDALWRLDLISNVKSVKTPKVQHHHEELQLVHYMLAPPLSLIHLCLKRGDFERAYQVIDIFDMRDHDINNEIAHTTKLLKFHKILKNCTQNENIAQIIEKTLKEDFKISNDTPKKIYLDFYDFSITTTNSREAYEYLLGITRDKVDSYFGRNFLELCDKIQHLPPQKILLSTNYALNIRNFDMKEEFYEALTNLFNRFYGEIGTQDVGTLNKSHECHKIIVKINNLCNEYINNLGQKTTIPYLIKIFNYLQAFSRILYIEANSSDIVSKGHNTSYFDLLHFNRSELTGKLLFERNLDPTEFERYFSQLKLDFLYHVVGNCFPTINLHVHENVSIDELYHDNMLFIPSKSIITYIQKRNWLLAFILNKMYKVEGFQIDVSKNRLQSFFNYINLQRIQHLKQLFDNNEVVAALQNCISAQTVKSYLQERTIDRELESINSLRDESCENVDPAEEIFEDVRTTNWKALLDIVDSIPENQLKKKYEFVKARNMILMNLVQDGVEPNAYRYTHFITNRDVRIDTILRNFKKWPGQFVLDIIQAELTKFDYVDDVKLNRLYGWKNRIQLCDKLRPTFDHHSWYRCHEFCKFDTLNSLKKILSTYNIYHLIDFIEIYNPSDEILNEIDLISLAKIIELNPPYTKIKLLLDLLPLEYAIQLCSNLITIVKNLNYLQFLADYLATNVTDDVFLRNVQLSLKILSVFTPHEQDQLYCLITEPINILEVLIMNTKLDKFAKVLELLDMSNPNYDNSIISIEKVDKLLRIYAEKSLDFRVTTEPKSLSKSPEFKLLQSMDSLSIINSEKRPFVMPEQVPKKDEWIRNEDVIDCMCCQQVIFSMFNRRHHCRRCGRVVCYNCSLKRMLVATYGDILVRVCNDCYDQTIGNSSSSERSDAPSVRSFVQEYWLLNDDPEHNKIVREEFSYEHAPSISLCFSLLKYHSKNADYPKFLLEQCEMMLQLLMPNQEPTAEIDYILVIRMLRSLTVAAKMLCAEHNLSSGIATADRILSQAELLGLLAQRGCLHLMPVISTQNSYVDPSVLRRLRDRLLQLEEWDVALDVSTKAGLDKSGIFGAWGKSCLKAGCLGLAREKFQRCFEKNYETSNRSEMVTNRSRYSSRVSNLSQSSDSKPSKDPPLLNDIIRILENETQIIYPNIPKEYQNIKISGSSSSLNQLPYLTVRTDPAISVLNRIKRLQDITNGKYCCSRARNKNSRKPTLDPLIFGECIYYLEKYGTNLSLLEFYIKHGRMDTALKYLLDYQLSTDLFVEIYMKCLRDGIIGLLQDQMIIMDPSLEIWTDYLKHICRHLEKQQLFNCLYQLQLFMSDYVRASMTCMRFYQENVTNFSELCSNVAHLLRAEEHLKQILEQDQWVEVSSVGNTSNKSIEGFEEKVLSNSSLVMKIDCKDVHKHIETIKKQIHLVKFFANLEKSGVNVMATLKAIVATNPEYRPTGNIPTLFGTNFEKVALASTAIVLDMESGFEVATDLINEYVLRSIKVFCLAGNQLAKTEQYSGIQLLVNNIKKIGINDMAITDMLDQVLTLAVGTLIKANITGTKVEDLIKLIRDKSTKISAYIEAKQLKTAYFLAVKYKRTADVRRIQREAELLHMPQIKQLCQKYLNNTTSSGSVSSRE